MANVPEYGCTRCNTPCPRAQLTVKKALFTEMGVGARTIRARVTDWLCPMCLKNDPDFQREKFSPPRIEKQIAV